MALSISVRLGDTSKHTQADVCTQSHGLAHTLTPYTGTHTHNGAGVREKA